MIYVFISDGQFGVVVKHAWKVHDVFRNKWYLFQCKISEEKDAWMSAFREERNKVLSSQRTSVHLTPRTKYSAYTTAKNMKYKPKKPKSKSTFLDFDVSIYMKAKKTSNFF